MKNIDINEIDEVVDKFRYKLNILITKINL